jgi:hypothetical protein
MDTELHCVSNAVGDVEKALLPSLAAGMDMTRRSIRRLP